jgi:ribosomal-protein-alanine N-acetyltransferase
MTPPADDVDRIMAVMTAAFDPAYGEAWSRRQVTDALLIGNCHYGLIWAGGSDIDGIAPEPEVPVAGFYLSRTGFEEEELLLFAIHPEYRRQGLGKTLLAAFRDAAKARGAHRLLLEMRRGNPAQSLYQRLGFRQIGERPKYYRAQHGERIDAITFALSL